MKKLLQKYKKKFFTLTYPRTPGSMAVLIIDDETDYMAQTMGITKEREDYLWSKFKEAKQKNCFFDLAKASAECKHPNELAWLAFVAGKYCQLTHSNPLMAFYARLLNQK